MTKIIEGSLNAKDLKLAVVVSRFNEFITDKLLLGALDTIRRSGGDDKAVEVIKVPGAFELPVIAKKLVSTRRYDGIICLGCVIRGGTPHFDYVAGQVARGISSVACESSTPIAFGVLTTDSLEQAIERAGSKMGNKGAEAALSVIETANVIRQLNADL